MFQSWFVWKLIVVAIAKLFCYGLLFSRTSILDIDMAVIFSIHIVFIDIAGILSNIFLPETQ
jgi:hypothetical protein